MENENETINADENNIGFTSSDLPQEIPYAVGERTGSSAVEWGFALFLLVFVLALVVRYI